MGVNIISPPCTVLRREVALTRFASSSYQCAITFRVGSMNPMLSDAAQRLHNIMYPVYTSSCYLPAQSRRRRNAKVKALITGKELGRWRWRCTSKGRCYTIYLMLGLRAGSADMTFPRVVEKTAAPLTLHAGENKHQNKLVQGTVC